MALPNSCLSARPSQFFVEQSARLSSLLDAVVAEANKNNGTNPDLCLEFQEAIQVLTDLLNQAQIFSIQGPEEFRGRWQEVQIFVSRAQAVQDALTNWNVRSQSSQSVTAKKRARSGTMDMATSCTDLKRHRSEEEDEMMGTEGLTKMMPIRTTRPASATPWWTQKLYD